MGKRRKTNASPGKSYCGTSRGGPGWLRRFLWRLVRILPVVLAASLGVAAIFLLVPNMFVVSTFIENAQASIEHKLDPPQRPPLDGTVWPGGDPLAYPTLLLQTWRYNGSHSSGRDPRLAPLTCRMYHVCQFADGAILFPEAYRGLDRHIKACGIQNYLFARQASPETHFDHSHALLDLVAPLVPPHSAAPVEQLLHFSQIVFGQHISAEEWSSETVDYRQYNGSGDLVDTVGQFDLTVAAPLRPLLYSRSDLVLDEIDEDGLLLKPTWERQVLDRLTKSMEGFEVHRIDDAFPSRADGSGDASTADKPQAVCYHSIMSTGEKGDELPPRMLGHANPFFERNRIDRHTRWLSREEEMSKAASKKAKDLGSTENAPRLRADDGNLNILLIRNGLSTADLDSVEKRIQARLQTTARDSKRELHVFVVRFSATADVSLLYLEFQRADVVVAARSAVLNNVLYMRMRSVLIEILPYSVPDETYGKFANTLGVSHVAIMAKADTKSFKSCIEKDFTTLESSKERLLKAWTEGAKQFVAGDRRSYMDFNSVRSQWRLEVPSAFSCASRQSRLQLVSTEAVLRAIFDRAVVPRL